MNSFRIKIKFNRSFHLETYDNKIQQFYTYKDFRKVPAVCYQIFNFILKRSEQILINYIFAVIIDDMSPTFDQIINTLRVEGVRLLGKEVGEAISESF